MVFDFVNSHPTCYFVGGGGATVLISFDVNILLISKGQNKANYSCMEL